MEGSGENLELVNTIREIHDGVYNQGKNDGVSEFLKYLFEHSVLLDGYEKREIEYYYKLWLKEKK